ncbi:MAG: hypothetical protein AAGC92_00560 [Pseudomonadota bacterium]
MKTDPSSLLRLHTAAQPFGVALKPEIERILRTQTVSLTPALPERIEISEQPALRPVTGLGAFALLESVARTRPLKDGD